MPELPEVETTVRAIKPVIQGLMLKNILVRNPNLRWKIPIEIKKVTRTTIKSVHRRAKYILMETTKGIIMIHLGMSGRLSVLQLPKKVEKHDHVDFIFEKNIILRYTDPRRFGSIHFIPNKDNTNKDDLNKNKSKNKINKKHNINIDKINEHPLISNLGPEPLSKNFDAKYLYEATRNRKTSIKQLIMNQEIVVGVGNIYANEALFLAHISPLRKASTLSLGECKKLVASIKTILKQAIKKGGTTLKDFLSPEGSRGYFSLKLMIYGRQNMPCFNCGSKIVVNRKGQRSTFYCPNCQD